ncbi:MAG: hypothetical protein HY665_08160 [Chloroflexi bacterium]|nr:hypothetical protein [Chloroflexota bacterium]
MPAYSRKSTVEEQFGARRFPGSVISCGSCNANLADSEVNPTGTLYVLYTDKSHLKENRPYDVYCEGCFKGRFPKAKIV